MSGNGYPKRTNHFAHRYCRLLIKTCAAQDIGHIGFCLCVTIAHTEDAKRYTAPVTFWNDQLISLLGLNSWGQLDRARKKAVGNAWLAYVPGGKGKVGKYWATIPAEFENLPDSAVDEDPHVMRSTDGEENEGEAGEKRGTNGEHSSLYPSPSPSKSPNGDSPPKQVWDGDGFPLSTGTVYRLPLEVYERYRATYSWDIDRELRKCAQWCRDNKSRRSRTARSMQGRITKWLNRADDSYRHNGNGQAGASDPDDAEAFPSGNKRRF